MSKGGLTKVKVYMVNCGLFVSEGYENSRNTNSNVHRYTSPQPKTTMSKTIFLSLLFILSVWKISSQNTPANPIPPRLPVASEESSVQVKAKSDQDISQRPEPEARFSFFLKGGLGISEMYDTKNGYATFQKTTWGFSNNLGIGARLRLSKRSSSEMELSALKMQSKVTGVHFVGYNFGGGQKDTLYISDGNIKADWLHLQLALKYRFQPKLSAPLFLNLGINAKRKTVNHSIWAQTITDIGEVVLVHAYNYEYRRYPTPRIYHTINTYRGLNLDLGLSLSVEYFPFHWSDRFSVEMEFNQSIPDYEGLGLSQHYLFFNLKYKL